VFERLRVGMLAPPWYEIPPKGYGGIEDMVGSLVDGLADRGHQVTLVAAGGDRTEADFAPTFDENPEGLGGPDGMAIEFVHAVRANERLEETTLDVVHDHTAIGPLFAPYRPVPTIVTVHGPVSGWMRRVYASLRGVSLVAISDAQRDAAPDLPWVGTIHNGIDVDAHPFRSEKDDFVLFLGRMNPEKGVVEAIELSQRIGKRLVIAAKCSDPDEIRYFEEHVRPALNGAEYVGDVQGREKEDLLARATALLFPIQWEEPFGLVMIEAMACGTPVLALRRGSVPEVVRDGVSGFVRDDLDGLVDAFARVHELSPDEVREDARRFDASRMVEGYVATYRAVIEGDTNGKRTGTADAEALIRG
jgi:glycosyltransferase involved in cell wall biosynthesis